MRRLLLIFLCLLLQDSSALSKKMKVKILKASSITKTETYTELTGPAKVQAEDVIISADKIKLSNKNNYVSANGNVIINHKDEIYTAEFVTIYPKEGKGEAKDVQGLLKRNYRVASKKMVIDFKKKSTAEYCTFSTCNKSSDDKDEKLLWDIKAKEVTYDKETETISYTGAYLELHGTPILFLPKFTHPSPKVKRKSGFLPPKIVFSKNLGLLFIPQYYFAISDSSELFLKPVICDKHSILWTKYNALLKNANISFSGSYQPSVSKKHTASLSSFDKKEFEKIKDRGYRGNLDGHVNISLSENINFFTNVSTVSDKSYLTIYSFLDHRHDEWISKTNLEESNIGAEYCNNLHYGIVKLITYQNVRLNNDYYKTPNVIPYLEHDTYKPLDSLFLGLGGLIYSDFISLNVDYKNDKKDNRLYWNGGYIRNLELPHGQIVTLNMDLIANVYKLRKYKAGKERDNEDNTHKNSSLNRVYPTLGLDYYWPLLASLSNRSVTCIVTPRIKLLLAPDFKKKHQDYLENSDLAFNYLESCETNIFNESKTSKINQINTGHKLTYGFSGSLYKNNQNILNWYIFQSHKLSKQTYKIPIETGYSQKTSALLFGMNYKFTQESILGADLAVNRDFSEILRSKVYLTYLLDKGMVSVGAYSGKQFDAKKIKSNFRNLFFSGSYNLTSKVTTRLETIVGIHGKIIKTNVLLEYNDSCMRANFAIERINYKKIDAKPDFRISFSVYLKGINSN